MANRTTNDVFEFGSWRLDAAQRVLTRNNDRVSLTPKTFDLLLLLVRSPTRAFSRHELMAELWPDTIVEEANLSYRISLLRKALGEDGRWIETVQKHGYRFSAAVKVVPAGATCSAGLAAARRGVCPGRGDVSAGYRRRTVSRLLLWSGVAAACWHSGRTLILPSRPACRANVSTPFRFRSPPIRGGKPRPSLSPDGSQVAFVWNGPRQDNFDIYVKLVATGEPLRLTTSPQYDDSPAWSPDGRTIAFLRVTEISDAGARTAVQGEVFVIPALGGAERRIATMAVPPHSLVSRALLESRRQVAAGRRCTLCERTIRAVVARGERFRTTASDKRVRADVAVRCCASVLARRTPHRVHPRGTREPRAVHAVVIARVDARRSDCANEDRSRPGAR